MPEPEKPTTLWIKPSTKAKLDKIGSKGETYDEIINRLISKDTTHINLDIANIKLYRQGLESVPFFINVPYYCGFSDWEQPSSFTYNEGIKNYGYWGHNFTTDLAREVLMKHIKDGVEIKKLMKRWEAVSEEEKEIEKSIKDLNNISNDDLLKLFRRYTHARIKSWDEAINIETFDAGGEDLISEVLNKFDTRNLTLKDFKILCSPDILTCIQKEQLSLYTIAAKKDYTKLKEHSQNFYWIKNTWADAKFLDEKFFIEKINRLEEEGIKFNEEIKKIEETHLKTRQEKQRIREKYPTLATEVERAIEFFELMTEWRELRKKNSLVCNHYLKLFVDEWSKRVNVKQDYLLFASHSEFSIPLPEGFEEELKRRAEFCIYYLDSGKETFVTGDSAKDFVKKLTKGNEKQTERLYGNVANPGHVEGIAKVIFTQNELGKMEKGDILVAPCTRPEYLPAMKKAKAIITDEGGITSHAAIVSRELGVPCIVGLQHATDIIKDGDLIDVNANHGIVSVKSRK
jgi:phosphohistidine swiveling domain-containing protein/(2Fe-2S) ferredoxin